MNRPPMQARRLTLRVLATRFRVLLAGVLLCAGATGAHAAILRKETAAAWDRYLAVSEQRMHDEREKGLFLLLDGWDEPRRGQAYNEVRQGTVLIQAVNTLEEGHPIAVPHGLIHDWQGVAFIPHATLPQTLAIVQDFDRYEDYYRPEIRHSRLLSHEGDNFETAMQLYKKSLITVAINARFDVHFEEWGPHQVVDRTCATRLAQVADPDSPQARELTPAEEDGYLWRLCNFWRFEEKDGGVYAQVESIGLSRNVPGWIAWLVNPLLKSLPRGTLNQLLTATRTAVEGAAAQPSRGPATVSFAAQGERWSNSVIQRSEKRAQ